jgi:hypothetical protein
MLSAKSTFCKDEAPLKTSKSKSLGRGTGSSMKHDLQKLKERDDKVFFFFYLLIPLNTKLTHFSNLIRSKKTMKQT